MVNFSGSDIQAVQVPQKENTLCFWATVSAQFSHTETFLTNKLWQDPNLAWSLKWNNFCLFLEVRVLKTTKGFPIIKALSYLSARNKETFEIERSLIFWVRHIKIKRSDIFFLPNPYFLYSSRAGSFLKSLSQSNSFQ